MEGEKVLEMSVPLLDTPTPTGSSRSLVEAAPTRRKQWKVNLKAIYFSFVAAIGAVGFGYNTAFSSPLLDEPNRNLSQFEEGFRECGFQVLIGPIAPVGAIVGALFSAGAIATLGLVLTMLISSATFVLGWLMLGTSFFMTDPFGFRALILTGRFVTGFSAGWITTAAPVYISEVSPEGIRGKLESFIPIGIGFGIFQTLLIGAYVPFHTLSFILMGTSVMHFFLLLTIPESPRRSRNPLNNVRKLFRKKARSDTHKKIEERDDGLFKGASLSRFIRQTIIVVVVFCVHELAGAEAIAFYAGPILTAGGVDGLAVPPDVIAAIAIGATQTFGAAVSVLFVDLIGRKVIMFLGGIGMFIGVSGMGLFFALLDGIDPHRVMVSQGNNTNVSDVCELFDHTANDNLGEQLAPLAILSMALFVFAFAALWEPPVFVFGTEMFNDKTRGIGVAIAFAGNLLSTTIITFIIPIMSLNVGEAAAFFLQAGIAGIAVIFVVFFVPETFEKPLGTTYDEDFSIKRNLKDLFVGFRDCFICKNVDCCKTKREVTQVREPVTPISANAV